jgi:FkbM family methyltransferase
VKKSFCGSERLVGKFGRPLYSQYCEELVVRDFFADRRGGIFVDVGAGPPKKDSTTCFLERHLGWTGIAVDARGKYAPGYARFRKGTRFFAYFVSDRSGGEVDFYVTKRRDGLSSTSDREWAARDGTFKPTRVPTITLDGLLRRAGIPGFDFLSLDIELAEPAALAGFDIERHRPSLVGVEMHDPVRAQVLEYFAAHGYSALVAYADVDLLNAYFVPRERS